MTENWLEYDQKISQRGTLLMFVVVMFRSLIRDIFTIRALATESNLLGTLN